MRVTWAAITPGYHLNKRHWITVKQDTDLPDEEILKLIDHAYDLVVGALPRRVRESLGW
jgi:predicted DNA-binding protein (MmcQ/YjbR family)